jgi:hypothetical protein
VSTLIRARRMAKVAAIGTLNKRIVSTVSKPSPVRVRMLFEEMKTEWKKYMKIFELVEDDDKFTAEVMVYEELAVEFYDAKSGMDEFLKAPMDSASSSPGTVSTTTTDSEFRAWIFANGFCSFNSYTYNVSQWG